VTESEWLHVGPVNISDWCVFGLAQVAAGLQAGSARDCEWLPFLLVLEVVRSSTSLCLGLFVKTYSLLSVLKLFAPRWTGANQTFFCPSAIGCAVIRKLLRFSWLSP
jgi:hypothetical protein